MPPMHAFQLPIGDPIGIFAILLLIALVTPIMLKPLRIPSVVGLIIGGFLVGPQGLGLINQGAIPELLGKIGIVYLMFLAGLEIDLHQLFRRRGQTLGFGLLTFFIPLGIGFAGGLLFHMSFLSSLLLASMFSSYTLLTYPEVSRFGLARNKAVTVAVGAIVITDVSALMVVALISAFTTGTLDTLYWVRLIGLITLFCVVVFWLMPLLTRRAFKLLTNKDDTQFFLVFALMFFMAALAAPAGLEPVIGAFLAGLALNRLIPETSILMNRLKFVGNTIFIPLFMVYVGLLIAPGDFIRHPDAWIFAAFVALAALAAKGIAALVSARANKFSAAEGWLMFGMTVNHAAVTLAVVLIGMRLGLFNDLVLTSTIILILVTCLTGSIVTDRAARKVSLQEALEREKSPQGTKRIMVSLANPDTASNLAELASYIAQPGITEALYPAAVVQDGPQSEEHLAKAEALLASASARMTLHNLSSFPVTGLDVNISSGLLRVSKARRANLIILGWNNNYTMGRSLFGSVLDQVIAQSPLRLLVAKLDGGLVGMETLTLMIPPLSERLDDLEESLRHAMDLARVLSLRTRVVAQVPTLDGCASWLREYQKHQAIEIQTLNEWSQLIPLVQKLSGPRDMLCLCSVRKHQLAWQPSLEKLPRRLAELFPNTRLLVIYPAQSAELAAMNPEPQDENAELSPLMNPGASAGPETQSGKNGEDYAPEPIQAPTPVMAAQALASPALVPDQGNSEPIAVPLAHPRLRKGARRHQELDIAHETITLDTAQTSIPLAVTHILGTRYDTGRVQEIMDALEDTGGLQAVELRDGVVLIHYHDEGCDEFWVGIGHFEQPLPGAGGETPIRTLCLLISPTALGPEAHLKALSSLARWVVKGGV